MAEFFASSFWTGFLWPLIIMVAESVLMLVVLLIAIAYILLADRKIVIDLDAGSRDWLAEKGYDPAYGARPLKRVIQKNLQDPLAEMILSGRVKDAEKVKISANKLGLTFNGKAAAAAA